MSTERPRKKRPGRYGKLYADLLTDPKLTRLMQGKNGHRAFTVHALALAWCSQHLTDGVIEACTLPILFGKPADAAALCLAGFWEPHPTGWQITGYTTANLTRSDVEARSLEGRISQCKRWMSEGKTCGCGHHTPTGDVIGDPIGDLLGDLVGQGPRHA